MYLYLIGAFDYNDILLAVKIGVTRDVNQRIASMQTGQFCEMKLILAWETVSRKKCFYAEKDLHQHYERRRMRGEWFRASVMKDIVPVATGIIGYGPCSVPNSDNCLKEVQDGTLLKRALRQQHKQFRLRVRKEQLLAA